MQATESGHAHELQLRILDGEYVVCQLDASAPVAMPTSVDGLFAVTRTAEELSVVCLALDAPAGSKIEGPWRALMVVGPLEFSLTGILASLAVPLADAGISIFALSTFDTDYLLVPDDRAEEAVTVLIDSGCSFD